MGGWGWLGSHKVAGKGYVFTKTSQMASIGVTFTSTYHTKQLNPWTNSSASRVVNYSQLSACQGDMQPFEGDPYTRGRLTSHSKSSPGNFQHQYLAELLVNMYSYCLMVKSVSCCCVRGSWLFSDLVTYTIETTSFTIHQKYQFHAQFSQSWLTNVTYVGSLIKIL